MRAYVLSLLMMTVSLAGCMGEGGLSSSDIGNTTEDELALPDWSKYAVSDRISSK